MTDLRTIRVTGKGQVKVKPDMTRIKLSLEGTYPGFDETLRKSARDTELLRELFAGLGFERSDLKTTSFGVDTEYESYEEKGKYKSRLAGYQFEHEMKIEFESDVERLGKILHALGKSRVKPEFSISYFVKDQEAVKNELLSAAVADSKKKALVLTQAAGVALKDILSIEYSWGQIRFEVEPFEDLCYEEAPSSDSDSYDLNIEPEDIETSDTVTILWEIE